MPSKDPYLERYEKAWQQAKDEQQGRNTRWSGITCPEQYDKICRLCQLTREVYKNRDSYTKEIQGLADDLRQKTKAYVNVVLKSDPKKVVVLEIGKGILGDLMDKQTGVEGEEFKNFTSLKGGRNVVIIKKKVQTRYKWEYKVLLKDKSAFPSELMKQAHDLESIEKLIAEKTITPLPAKELEEGPNEMRILPNWRYGEKVELFFYSLKHHTGLTRTEWDLVQAGQYNPYSNVIIPDDVDIEAGGGFSEEGEPDVPMFDEPAEVETEVTSPFGTDETGEGTLTTPSIEEEETAGHSPCFGLAADYNPEDDECKECPEQKECAELAAKEDK